MASTASTESSEKLSWEKNMQKALRKKRKKSKSKNQKSKSKNQKSKSRNQKNDKTKKKRKNKGQIKPNFTTAKMKRTKGRKTKGRKTKGRKTSGKKTRRRRTLGKGSRFRSTLKNVTFCPNNHKLITTFLTADELEQLQMASIANRDRFRNKVFNNIKRKQQLKIRNKYHNLLPYLNTHLDFLLDQELIFSYHYLAVYRLLL